MKMNLRSLLMRLVLATGLGVIAPSVQAQNNTGTHYIYNGQTVALQASTTEVLVKPAAPAQATTAQAMNTTLALPQNGVSAVAPLTIAGWNKVTLAASASVNAADTNTQARTMVSTLAAQPGVSFVSPLLTAANGSQLAPTAQILVGYKPTVNVAQTFTRMMVLTNQRTSPWRAPCASAAHGRRYALHSQPPGSPCPG